MFCSFLGALTAVAMATIVWSAVAPLPAAAAEVTTDWPPAPCDAPAGMDKADGRKIDSYRHGVRQEWGYAQKKDFPLYVVHPKTDREGAPLYVVLHSAGHNEQTSITAGYQRSPDGAYNDHGLYHAPDDCYGLYPQGDAWWGRDGAAVEKRVLDTVAWAIAKYKIDPNRVYLAGISMGGSGSLGIGMRHGEVFASEMVWVPAGTGHVARSMFFGDKTPAEAAIADPPVLVNISAQNDGWSKGQDVLLNGVAQKKFAMILGWGPLGHTGDTRVYVKNCPEVMAYPWLEIRRNEAYPVFLGATSDQKPPWLHPKDADEHGQMNAFFRWKNVKDEPAQFAMRLWIEQPAKTEPAHPMPKESVADVTFRRVQKFKVPSGKSCSWELIRDGKSVASGEIQPDADGLLTIPKVTVTGTATEVRLAVR